MPEIVFEDENLKHMFAEENLTRNKRKNIYHRFIPKSKMIPDISSFVEMNILTSKSFYSFLAEGVLKFVFRDLYDFSLVKGMIDIGETLSDLHTGVNACLHNFEHNVIVLDEAKFYESLDGGMRK